jgi:hypothetical protein
MKTALAAVLALGVSIASSAATLRGVWTSTPGHDGALQLNLNTNGHNNLGNSFKLSELTGLQPAALTSASTTPVNFELRREAGTIAFEGTFRDGYGAGRFTFEPDRAFVESLRGMGLQIEPKEDRSEEQELLVVALVDATRAYIRSMRDLFPEASLREIRNARAVGVDSTAIRAIRSSIPVESLREATNLTAVGVTTEYLREMQAAGVKVTTARDATRLRAVGVTPDFVARMAAAGYANLSARDLTRLAATGVDPEFARSIKKQNKQK